ncbi:hypothetical protein M8N35_10695, partial [Enterobacter roggenkampii]|uniref:hypothetical protein n=1 Tax=Enterobacter roggenkampii TaxID=1812935 RepID=UPI0020751EB1
ADRNRSHWRTSKTPSYTKSVSWHHYLHELKSSFQDLLERCRESFTAKMSKTIARAGRAEERRVEKVIME